MGGEWQAGKVIESNGDCKLGLRVAFDGNYLQRYCTLWKKMV